MAKMAGPSPLLRARCCMQSRGSWEGECMELGLEGQNDLVQGPLHSFKSTECLLHARPILGGRDTEVRSYGITFSGN